MPEVDIDKLNYTTVQIANDLILARDLVVDPIMSAVADCGYCSQDEFALRLALEEAICNAYHHGNKEDPRKTIRVRWSVDEEVTVIRVADDGKGFDPDCLPDPRTDENREKPCGRGVMLIRAYMTELRFNEQCNEICMIKTRKRPGLASTG